MSTRNTLLASLVIIIAIILGLLALISSNLQRGELDNTAQPPVGVIERPTPLPYNYIPPELATRLPTQDSPSYIGNPVPEIAVQTLDGDSIRLTDFEGEIVVLNFWASWCVPCQEELPLLQNYARNAGDDIQIIALTNPNNGQTIDDVSAFLETYNITDLLVALDQHNALHSTFGVIVLPYTYFIDANGFVAGRVPGIISAAEVDRFVRELQES